MTLKAYVMVNGDQVKALCDIGTMGHNLISEKFVSRNRIATKNLEVSIFLKMVIKGSRYTINYKVKPVIQIGTESGKISEVLVSFLKNCDIFLRIPYLNRH
jgi:hypothetical protein